MTTAPDTPQERMAEYARLFEHALTGRERTARSTVWRFTARAGVAGWVRDLAAREAACCPFLTYTVTEHDGRVDYEVAGDDDPTIRSILDEIHQLPDHVTGGLSGLLERLGTAGLDIETSDDGRTMTANSTHRHAVRPIAAQVLRPVRMRRDAGRGAGSAVAP